MVCKWTYICDKDGLQGWNKEFFESIGLGDLVKQDFQQIGNLNTATLLKKIPYINDLIVCGLLDTSWIRGMLLFRFI